MKHYIYIGIILLVSVLFISIVKSETFFSNTSDKIEDVLYRINSTIKRKYKINSNDVKTTNLYYKETVPNDVKRFLDNNIEVIINKINAMGNNNYIIMNYETIIVQEGTSNSKHYLTDVFIYQTKKDIMTKLLVDLFEFNDNKVYVNNVTISNSHIDKCDLDSSKKNDEVNYKDNNEETQLDYSFLDTNIIEISNNEKSFNPWILPEKVNELRSEGVEGWPCGKSSDEWDTYGIQKNKPSQDKLECRDGYNKATQSRNIVPQQNPTVIGLPKKTQYSWLFNLFRGIPSFPTGSSLGSGSGSS